MAKFAVNGPVENLAWVVPYISYVKTYSGAPVTHIIQDKV